MSSMAPAWKHEVFAQVANRALHLLKQSPSPQREMSWAEDQLREANLLGFSPERQSLARWTEQAIAQNPDLRDKSLPWLRERDSHPEKAETFEELILRLIPSEGGL